MAIFASTKRSVARRDTPRRVSPGERWECVTKSTPIQSLECPQRGTLLPRSLEGDLPVARYRCNSPEINSLAIWPQQ
jgi:hypothetical protein